MFFKIAEKETNRLGDFCLKFCRKEPSKIAKSGHTDHHSRRSIILSHASHSGKMRRRDKREILFFRVLKFVSGGNAIKLFMEEIYKI